MKTALKLTVWFGIVILDLAGMVVINNMELGFYQVWWAIRAMLYAWVIITKPKLNLGLILALIMNSTLTVLYGIVGAAHLLGWL
jgi:hypothetical protein